MDCHLPGSSVHGILQAKILERVAISFSRGTSQPRDRTQVSCMVGRRFTIWTTGEAHSGLKSDPNGESWLGVSLLPLQITDNLTLSPEQSGPPFVRTELWRELKPFLRFWTGCHVNDSRDWICYLHCNPPFPVAIQWESRVVYRSNMELDEDSVVSLQIKRMDFFP